MMNDLICDWCGRFAQELTRTQIKDKLGDWICNACELTDTSRVVQSPPKGGKLSKRQIEKAVQSVKKPDMVNHPPHYTQHPSGVECIQVTEHMNFCLGNAIKYLWRTDHKNGLEDLKKARWYLDREIARREKGK